MTRLALDTNVLVYAEGVNDPGRTEQARRLTDDLVHAEVVLPVQVLGELFRVLVGKARRSPTQARASLLRWQARFEQRPTTVSAFDAATTLAADHGLTIWNAIILAVAAEAECRLLLSENMQHGSVWRGVTIVNPFDGAPHPLLTAALGPPP